MQCSVQVAAGRAQVGPVACCGAEAVLTVHRPCSYRCVTRTRSRPPAADVSAIVSSSCWRWVLRLMAKPSRRARVGPAAGCGG